MDRVRALQWTVVAAVVVSLLLSGPAVGLLAPSASTTETVGNGNATVVAVSIAEPVRIDRGRFGTGVLYARLPDAHVSVADVTGRPRLRYHVQIHGLPVEAVRLVQLDGDDEGPHRLRLTDQALSYDAVTEDRYRATVTVRVQSFDGDWTVYRRNTTVVVPP